jgi:hypothetical protein
MYRKLLIIKKINLVMYRKLLIIKKDAFNNLSHVVFMNFMNYRYFKK